MQLMKYSPLALLVAGLMTSSGLAAREWNTVAARATAARLSNTRRICASISPSTSCMVSGSSGICPER